MSHSRALFSYFVMLCTEYEFHIDTDTLCFTCTDPCSDRYQYLAIESYRYWNQKLIFFSDHNKSPGIVKTISISTCITFVHPGYVWRLNIPDLPLDSWLVPPPPHHLLFQQCYHLHCPGHIQHSWSPSLTFLPPRISGSGLFLWQIWRRFSSCTDRVKTPTRGRRA